MNIRQVEVFREIMLSGSMTEAAHRMRVSQPSLSKHLRLLESALGFPLFGRTGNQLIPTTEARVLFEQVQQVYTGLDALTQFADDLKHNRHGEVSVAAMPLIAEKWLARLMARFSQDHPDVSLSLPVRSTNWIARAIAAGTVDIGIGIEGGAWKELDLLPLLRLPLVCVCPADHSLAGQSIVSPEALGKHTLITLNNFDGWRLNIEQLFDRHAVGSGRRLDTFTTHVACELALHGAGVAVVDLLTAAEYRNRGMVVRPVATDVGLDIYLIQPSQRRLSRVAQAIRDVLLDEAVKKQRELDELTEALSSMS